MIEHLLAADLETLVLLDEVERIPPSHPLYFLRHGHFLAGISVHIHRHSGRELLLYIFATLGLVRGTWLGTHAPCVIPSDQFTPVLWAELLR